MNECSTPAVVRYVKRRAVVLIRNVWNVMGRNSVLELECVTEGNL